jgi:hypothetical protein
MVVMDYQRAAKVALDRHFEEVQLEWYVVKYATDLFTVWTLT